MTPIFDAYRAAYADLPRDTWLLAVITFINRSGTMVLPFLTLYITESLDQDASTAGLFVMIYGVGALIGTALGGQLTDRVGPVPVQVVSLCTAGFLFLALAAIRSTYAIAGLLLVLGVFADAYRPAAATLLAATCPPDQRTRAFALLRMAANFGMSVGPALGGLLAAIGYFWLFCIDGLTSLAAGLLVAVMFRSHSRSAAFDRARPGSSDSPWRDPVMVGTTAVTFLIGCVFFQMFSTLPLYFREVYGFSKWTIGALLALNPLMVVLLEMLVVHRLRRSNPLKAVSVGALLVGFGFGLLPLGHGVLWAILATVIWTIGEILWSPLLAGFVANRASDQSRGRYMGLYGLNFAAILIVAPAMGTAIYDWVGPDLLWSGSAVVGVICCGGYWALASRLRGSKATGIKATGIKAKGKGKRQR